MSVPTQYEYLYQRLGPWPQPSPSHPQGEAPSVVHIPKSEQKHWDAKIGARYLRQMLTYWPVAAWKAITSPHYPEVSNAEFEKLMLTGIYTRFLVPTLDAIDRQHFAPLLAAAPPSTIWWKMDFTPIKGVNPDPGMYVAASVLLIRQDVAGGDMAIVAAYFDNLLLQPEDGAAWDLGKYFVMQAAAYGILFTVHPNLHFPFDSINAITKTAVPMAHPIFKLLQPHLDFQLALNNAVLNSKDSVISNKKHAIYDPFTARADAGLMNFFTAGYMGIPGNSAYPPYDYARRPKPVYGDYGRFLVEYYPPFLNFARAVAATIPPGDPVVVQWANYIHYWIPGFPDGNAVFASPDALPEVIAGFMWDVTVGHAVDHASFGWQISVLQRCLRLRLPPPASTQMGSFDRTKLCTRMDLFRAYLAEKVFFQPYNVTKLVNVRYDFTDPNLIAAANTFQHELRAAEDRLEVQGVPIFIKLDEISASIQY